MFEELGLHIRRVALVFGISVEGWFAAEAMTYKVGGDKAVFRESGGQAEPGGFVIEDTVQEY